MMQRNRGKKAVDGGNRAAHLCQKPAPTVGHGEVDRKDSAFEPRRKLMFQP